MGMAPSYGELFIRNQGYVSPVTQERIKNTKVLIAGCGVGSTIAEAAARVGFQQFVLADADTVDIHNLNRQAFSFDDVGEYKVTALARRLVGINPLLSVKEVNAWISQDNVADLVNRCGLIFDTIDFLDLKAITALHDEANRQKKPVISCVSAGWGAAAVYFPPNTTATCHFRRLFGLPDKGPVDNASYVEHFSVFIQRIAQHLDHSVVDAMTKALTIMEDGTPCPAPHVSAGSFAVASLAVTMAVRILGGEPVTSAPRMVLANMGGVAASAGVDLTP